MYIVITSAQPPILIGAFKTISSTCKACLISRNCHIFDVDIQKLPYVICHPEKYIQKQVETNTNEENMEEQKIRNLFYSKGDPFS